MMSAYGEISQNSWILLSTMKENSQVNVCMGNINAFKSSKISEMFTRMWGNCTMSECWPLYKMATVLDFLVTLCTVDYTATYYETLQPTHHVAHDSGNSS